MRFKLRWNLPALFAPDIRQKTRGYRLFVDLLPTVNAMQEEFLPAFSGEATDDSDYRLELTYLPVKYSGLALPTTAKLNHQAR